MISMSGLRIHVLAATEIQRAYRGYLDRKKINRRKQWESTKPGPERIKVFILIRKILSLIFGIIYSMANKKLYNTMNKILEWIEYFQIFSKFCA